MSFLSLLFGHDKGQPKQGATPAGHRTPKEIGHPNRDEIQQYVTVEIEEALSADWKVVRFHPERLVWSIEKVKIAPGEWPTKDYSLILTDDLQWFIFTHGNKDAGCYSVWHEMHSATVFRTSLVALPGAPDLDQGLFRRVSLRQCIRELIQYREPNEWGYT